MSVPKSLNKLLGKWRGVNRLHTTWIKENPLRESDSEALISFSAQGKFLKIEYDWFFEEKKQEGLILLGDETDLIKAYWIDSWHLGDKFMVSEGISGENGAISMKGFYTVPDNPDWGWRTDIETVDEKSFKITMFNVTPEGEESLAVEAEYERI
ncbi:MAG TPA: DUF1579 family protein [Pyrinomonadaceae bacterium]|nr:DUF1579 family protein [Pyrinomonadaceae bacterium]